MVNYLKLHCLPSLATDDEQLQIIKVYLRENCHASGLYENV